MCAKDYCDISSQQRSQDPGALTRGHLSCQQGGIDAETTAHQVEVGEMLLSQKLSGSHDGHLPTTFRGPDGSTKCHHRLARAAVPNENSVHLAWSRQVRCDFIHGALLRRRKSEGQRCL